MKRSVVLAIAVMAMIFPRVGVFAKDKSATPQREEGIAGGWPEITNNEGDKTRKVKEKVMMVSWGDVVFMYGPETDAGLATPEQIQNMMKYWKANGFTQIFWRGEDSRDPNFKWNESTIYAEGSFIKKEGGRVMDAFDTTVCAIKAAHENGMRIYMWQSVFDDGTPANKPHRFWHDRFPWRNTFFDRHPEMEDRDRQGTIQWGVRELACPLARSTKIADYISVVRKYPELDGVFIYFHSHSTAGYNGDQYGFNPFVVAEYKKRYGVDILTDPRFDYKNPKFDPHDEAVEKWRVLRGEYLTQFLREMKAALKEVRPGLKIAINTQGGDYMGPPFGNMKIDWRTWIKDGLTDELILRTWMAGSAGAYDFSKEGYLTWGDGNLGVTPYEEIRKVITASGHDIKVITRTRAYIEDADGYYDSSNRDEGYPKKQRQVQLEQNMAKDGKIVYIDQNFENYLPLEETGCLDCTYGGKRYFIGDMRYWASKNTSPGFAGPLTTDINDSPALLDVRGMGGKGFAVYIDASGKTFNIHRRSGAGWPDDALAGGHVFISFDVYRKPSATLSVHTVTQNGKAVANAIELQIGSDGAVSAKGADKWRSADFSIPENAWTPVAVTIDFAKAEVTTMGKEQTKTETVAFDVAHSTFNGLDFRCRSGGVYVDNIKIVQMK